MDDKIILFTNSSNNIVQLRQNLISYLFKENIHLTVCVPECYNKDIFILKEKYKFKIIKIKNHRSSIGLFSNLIYCLKVIKILKKNKYDLIITFTIKPNILVSLSNYFLNNKIINVVTGLGSSFLKEGFLKKIILFMYKLSAKKSNLVIFQNKSDKKYFLEKKIVTKKKSLVIFGSGIDTTLYNFIPKVYDKTEIKYLYAGRLIKDKGVLELLKSFQIITNHHKNIKLILAGNIDDENPSKLNARYLKKFQSENIIFVGHIKKLKDLITDCHFSILLSHREGISNFLLESASIGRPLISTNVPGCREIVSSENGFLCNKNDIENILVNINKSIDLDNTTYQNLSKMSRKKVLQEFDNKIVINKFIQVIKDVLNENV